MPTKDATRPAVERARQATAFLKNNLSPQMRLTQLDLLLAVYEKPGSIMRELAVETGMTMSGISRAFDSLSKEGRKDVEGNGQAMLRTEDGKDERIKRVYLTGKGQEVISAYLELLEP